MWQIPYINSQKCQKFHVNVKAKKDLVTNWFKTDLVYTNFTEFQKD